MAVGLSQSSPGLLECFLASSFPKHRLPIFQTFTGRFDFRKPAALLFDEEILDATHRFGRSDRFFPWRRALAEQHSIALFFSPFTWRPVLQMHALDPAG